MSSIGFHTPHHRAAFLWALRLRARQRRARTQEATTILMIAPGVVAAATADAPPAISADILEVLMESGYGVYVIKISSVADGYNAYTLKRRYRQFDQMHAQLKTNYRGLPDLPGKSLCASTGTYESVAQAFTCSIQGMPLTLC